MLLSRSVSQSLYLSVSVSLSNHLSLPLLLPPYPHFKAFDNGNWVNQSYELGNGANASIASLVRHRFRNGGRLAQTRIHH